MRPACCAQPPPFSSDYPYRLPRVDDVWYQAALPELVAPRRPALPAASAAPATGRSGGGSALGSRAAQASPSAAALPPLSQKDAKRQKKQEKGRTPAQRLRDLLSRVTAPSALASAAESCTWSPEEAFARTTPEEVAAFLAFYRTVVAGQAESDVHFAVTACRASFSLALIAAAKEVRALLFCLQAL